MYRLSATQKHGVYSFYSSPVPISPSVLKFLSLHTAHTHTHTKHLTMKISCLTQASHRAALRGPEVWVGMTMVTGCWSTWKVMAFWIGF
ncbi:UNVERIFIED_CONTAM: hypothetical protein FKN15_050589 [Acipenser sinensis]